MGKRETSRGFSATLADVISVSNTTAETPIYTQVIPSGKMGVGKKLSLNLLATLTTPLVSLPTMTIRVKLGNAVMLVANNIGLAVSQSNTPFIIEATIRNKDSPNIQIAFAKTTQAGSNLPMLLANASMVYGDWAIDTTADQTLSVTVQFGSLSGSTVFTLRDVDLDLS